MWNMESHVKCCLSKKSVGKAMIIDSKYKKKHIVAKDVVGLLQGMIVSTKKIIITKDVVGLLV
jgi:hypothetical protein